VNGNPISFVDPFGMSADRGNNFTVLSELKGLYNSAYEFYDYVSYDTDRIKFANNAVMKYIIYQRFYESGGKMNEIAWQAVAGNIDYQFVYYAEALAEYRSLQIAVFHDPSSDAEIDFVHMIATLNANYSDRLGWGAIDYSLNAYAGWAGDLITLAGDIQNRIDDGKNIDISEEVKELLSGKAKDSSFSNSDLLADIDAVLIARSLGNTPIYQAIESYYQSDYTDRYNLFLQEELGGSVWRAKNIAKSYLYPSVLTNKFKDIFGSSYSKKIIPDVAKGFAEYIGDQAGR